MVPPFQGPEMSIDGKQDVLSLFDVRFGKQDSHKICFSFFWGLLQIDRMKFRSQTSDNMDSWKSRGGKIQRGEVKK